MFQNNLPNMLWLQMKNEIEIPKEKYKTANYWLV